MKRTLLLAAFTSAVLHAQIGRTLDSVGYGGDPQRSGWEKSDSKFRKSQVATEFQFLWKYKPAGPATKLFAPSIVGTLVGSRGFKELAFVGGANDSIHALDADVQRVYFTAKLGNTTPKGGCGAGMPSLTSIVPRRPLPRPGAANGAPVPAPAKPSTPAIFAPRNIVSIASDGTLHRINIDSGKDAFPPTPVIPAGGKMSPLNIVDHVIYFTASAGCGVVENTVWAIDMLNPGQLAKGSYKANAGFEGLAGPVIGNDNIVYVQSATELLALAPITLELKGAYPYPAADASPTLFAFKGRDIIVTAGKDGKLNLVDSKDMKMISQTAGGDPVKGGLSTWDDEGTRYVLAPIWNDHGRKGAIAAYKVDEQDGKPVLTKAWTSRELIKPAPPVIANGIVFALSSGDGSTHAVLYGFDALTGKEIWSTKNRVSAAGNGGAMTMSNGRIYFGTNDGAMWVFGQPLEF